MTGRSLTFATGKRYATKFFTSGAVGVEGFDLEFPSIQVGQPPSLFFLRGVTTLPYDIAEQAFAHYLIARDRGKPLTAIPAFPSRFFPHLGVSVRPDAGIQAPGDLVGKRVGAPDFAYNPAVWMRAILADQYEVPTESIAWVEDAGRPFFGDLAYPQSRRFQIESVDVSDPEMKFHGMAGLLERKSVDAVFMASGGMPPSAGAKKLFPDPYPEIQQYVERTGVFPINTVITIRNDVVQAHPELPAHLMTAFDAAEQHYRAELDRGEEPDHMGLETSRLAQMGLFPTGLGIGPNRTAIRMMIHYCYGQGLIRTLFEPEDVFLNVF